MFLTLSAKDAYIRLVNALAEMMDKAGGESGRSELPPLSPTESQILRELASELRHQLAEDVGSAKVGRGPRGYTRTSASRSSVLSQVDFVLVDQ